MKTPRLHIVTDDATLARRDFLQDAIGLVEAAGPDVAVHVRGHNTPAARLHHMAFRLVAAASDSGAVILVNDRIDIALSADAHGIQLGRRSIPVREARTLAGTLAIGYSAHGVAEAADAIRDGADFIVFGSVWRTASHPDRQPCGTDALERVAAQVGAPVIAIGGITPERVSEVVRAGASGVAVLSGVWAAPGRLDALERFRTALAALQSPAVEGARA